MTRYGLHISFVSIQYVGCDGVKPSLLGAKIQVSYIWRIRSHLPCHIIIYIIYVEQLHNKRTLLLLYGQVFVLIRYLHKENLNPAVLDIRTMG